jgi:hypothetical protein
MQTKFYVKQVKRIEGQEAVSYDLVGTAVVEGERGFIMTNAYGRLNLFRKEQQKEGGEFTMYVVKKARGGKGEGEKAIWNEVGAFGVKRDNSRAFLSLHLLEETFPAYPPKEASASGSKASKPAKAA